MRSRTFVPELTVGTGHGRISGLLIPPAAGAAGGRDPGYIARISDMLAVHFLPTPGLASKGQHVQANTEDVTPPVYVEVVEQKRLNDTRERGTPWKKWGPYLSERQWGTVREDYSGDGNAWDYFTHDQARSRAYRCPVTISSTHLPSG
jgi:hypothetical protein